eukprot:GEMP01059889.1.p1 GENE.GEMP01059889.1~~GEMP01059889.1.p1  ORF type:complete len:328 (+),score=75.03 GEMP01059889.1:156-1139(+)
MDGFQEDPFLTSAGRTSHVQSQPLLGRTSAAGATRLSVKGARGPAFRSNAWSMLATIFVPSLAFVAVMSLFTFAFHSAALLVYTWAVGQLVISALCPFLDRRNRLGGQWYLKLGVLCGIATVVASILGMYNYEQEMANYWTYRENQKYTNVLPTEPAAAHADAGKIIFSDTTRVDSTKAIGYKAGTVYCVAPILDDMQQTNVQYWAAGTDCCQQRAEFNCDDAWNPKARSGVVIIDPEGWLFSSKRKFYLNAVSEAEAAFDLVSAKQPLLIRWVIDPDAVQANYWRGGIGFCCAVSIIYVIASFLPGCIMQMSFKRSASARTSQMAV